MQTIDLDQLTSVTGGLKLNGGEIHRQAGRSALEGAKVGALLGAPFWLFPIIPIGTAIAGAAVGYAGGAIGEGIAQYRDQRKATDPAK
jgi:hypothetical protein